MKKQRLKNRYENLEDEEDMEWGDRVGHMEKEKLMEEEVLLAKKIIKEFFTENEELKKLREELNKIENGEFRNIFFLNNLIKYLKNEKTFS